MVDSIDIRCADEGELPFHYGIAGLTLCCQFAIPHLSMFRLPGVNGGRTARSTNCLDRPADDDVRKRAHGWVAGAWRDVTLASGQHGFSMSVPDVASFDIDTAGRSIRIGRSLLPTDSDVFIETLLGPALVFALALRGVWCMHASAVQVDSGVVLFVGESGAGKSTLARFLAETRACEVRVADDILPVGATREGLVCLPRFPQLGLAADAHYLGSDRIPICAVYELSRSDDRLEIEPYDPARTTLVWVRHTVAARLFPGEILQAQLQFAVDALNVPVFGVRYPHRRQSLDWFSRQIAEHGPVAA